MHQLKNFVEIARLFAEIELYVLYVQIQDINNGKASYKDIKVL